MEIRNERRVIGTRRDTFIFNKKKYVSAFMYKNIELFSTELFFMNSFLSKLKNTCLFSKGTCRLKSTFYWFCSFDVHFRIKRGCVWVVNRNLIFLLDPFILSVQLFFVSIFSFPQVPVSNRLYRDTSTDIL